MKTIPIIFMGLMAQAIVFAQNSDSAEVYFQKGIEAKSAKLYLVASNHLNKSIQFNPKFKEAYLENGYVYLEMRKQEDAKLNFTKVCDLDPDNQPAIKELMELYFNHRQFDKAKEFALKCKNCASAEKIIGISSYQKEDYGNAVKSLSNYLAKNPTDAEATYTLGRSLLDMEQEEKAVPYYTKAVLLEPEKSSWLNELGLLYYHLDDFKNAVVCFTKAIEKGYPQSKEFSENLAYSYINSGEIAKGEKLMNNLLEKMPGNTEMIWDLADNFYKTKQYDKCLSYCQKLVELDKNDAKALYQAGLCFQKKGDTDKGQKMCDKAINMDPSLGNMRKQINTEAGL